MKTSAFLFAALLAASFSTKATVHTVNNNLNGPGLFTTIQAAHDVAAAGDTIYLASSPSAYGGASFSKKIILIGAGMRPGEKKDNSNYSFLNGEISLNAGSDNSVIMGILFNANIIRARNGVSNCQILRNYWSTGGNHIYFESGSFTGWLIANNYFVNSCNGNCINMNSLTVTNFLIMNNVFSENTGCDVAFVGQFNNSANCIFSNNIVYSQGTGDRAFAGCNNFNVENNIFYTAGPMGMTNGVFNNNITFGTAQDALPYSGNAGANNVANTDPQLTTFSTANFGPYQNFQPAAGPAKTGGVGGTQMGVYGGSFNWNNSAVPPIPQIKNFSITSGATVPAGGSMTIKVTSTKQN